MTTQAQYTFELEQVASKNVATPVSYIGGWQMFSPKIQLSSGWTKTGWVTLAILYVVLVPTLFYAALSSVFGLLWIGWFVFTQSRRHRIRAARETIATRDNQIGSGGYEAA